MSDAGVKAIFPNSLFVQQTIIPCKKMEALSVEVGWI